MTYFPPMGGRIARGERSSFAQRDQTLMFAAGAVWDSRVEDDAINTASARGFKAALMPYLTGGVYVNEPAPTPRTGRRPGSGATTSDCAR